MRRPCSRLPGLAQLVLRMKVEALADQGRLRANYSTTDDAVIVSCSSLVMVF